MEQNLNSDGKPLTVRLRGDLTSGNDASNKAMMELAQAARSEGRTWRDVKLDLTEARMIDSVGLNLIVSVFKAVEKNGGRLSLAYSDPNVLRTLAFTRLDKRMDLTKVEPRTK